MSNIQVVGIGLDGAAGLSGRTMLIVKNATILVGSARHLSYFAYHPAKRIVINDINKTIEQIKLLLKYNERIVILVNGDPLFFGLGQWLVKELPTANLHFHPHITPIQLAFNRIQISWQDARIISVAGSSMEELTKLLQQGTEKIALLTDSINNPAKIACLYTSLDLQTSYDFWICENLGDPQEKISYCSSTDITQLQKLTETNFDSLNIVILIRQDRKQQKHLETDTLPLLGIFERDLPNLETRPGSIAQREVRLVILGELALKPKQIVWDLGAETGLVSLEIARICPTSQIFAVEQTAINAKLIEQTCQHLKVNNVITMSGSISETISKLPAPNRVFINGTNVNLKAVLDICDRKLTLGGIVVLAVATLEELNLSLEWFSTHSWHYRLLQLQISRSVSTTDLIRFSPLNPVTIITAQK